MRNHCRFTGRTTREIDFKITGDGKRRAVFTIAVDKFGRDKEADFVQIIAFDDLAARLADHVGKGSLITVDARYKPGKYQKEGRTEYTHDFIAFNVDFLALKSVDGAQGNNNNNGQPVYGQDQPNMSGGQPNFGPGSFSGQPHYAGEQPNNNYPGSFGGGQPTYPSFPNQPPTNYPNPYE